MTCGMRVTFVNTPEERGSRLCGYRRGLLDPAVHSPAPPLAPRARDLALKSALRSAVTAKRLPYS